MKMKSTDNFQESIMPADSDRNLYFKGREDAAAKLIEALPLELLKNNETVVIGVSEGGVYFADRIAKAIGAQMDILLTEPILAPNNPEVAIAMISETEEVQIRHCQRGKKYLYCNTYSR